MPYFQGRILWVFDIYPNASKKHPCGCLSHTGAFMICIRSFSSGNESIAIPAYPYHVPSSRDLLVLRGEWPSADDIGIILFTVFTSIGDPTFFIALVDLTARQANVEHQDPSLTVFSICG
jgi:hypothetical protein